MGKLIFGKNGQVHFNNENEKQEAIEYLLTSDNVDFDVHEDNQEQGAWGPEERIHFKSEEKPGVISQIYQIVSDERQQELFCFLTHCNAIHQHHNDRCKHPHNTHQQVYLQHPPRHPVTAAFNHVYHKHAENKEEGRYQRITAEIVVREYRIINPSAYAAHQYR